MIHECYITSQSSQFASCNSWLEANLNDEEKGWKMKYLWTFLITTVITGLAVGQFIFEDDLVIVHMEFNVTEFNESILLTQKELLARRGLILEHIGQPAKVVSLSFVEKDGNVTVGKGKPAFEIKIL